MRIKESLCLICDRRNPAVTAPWPVSRASWPLGYMVTPVTAIFLKNNYFYFSSHSSIGLFLFHFTKSLGKSSPFPSNAFFLS